MSNEFPSIYLLAVLFGWLVAHLVKFLLTFVASGGREKSLSIFFRAGGMPSSHSAVMVAVLAVIGGREGIGSPLFGLALATTVVIFYDAINVRRSVGEQGDALRKLAPNGRFFTAYGHTFTEVIAGSVVGLMVAWILLQIL